MQRQTYRLSIVGSLHFPYSLLSSTRYLIVHWTVVYDLLLGYMYFSTIADLISTLAEF